MAVLETIAAQAGKRALEFLVIGGHAVMAHGFARSTFDLDLLVRGSERPAWKELMTGLGWRVYAEAPTFLQFEAPADQPDPVDLMFVNDPTFARLSEAAMELRGNTIGVKVVSLPHLLALKCHAIKHGHPGRVEKDVDDVIQLVKINRLDVQAGEFRDIILKHGVPELYEKLKRISGQN